MGILYLIITSFMLSACNPFGYAKPDSEKIVQSAWAYNPPKPMPQPLYCYRTLGEPMCYTDPVEGANNRLAGRYEPYIPPQEKPWWEYEK